MMWSDTRERPTRRALMIDFLKRWAFVPLLALVCMLVVGRLLFGSDTSTLHAMYGLLIVPPLAFLIDRRRQRPHERRRRLTFWT
jgi:hypothetical protein